MYSCSSYELIHYLRRELNLAKGITTFPSSVCFDLLKQILTQPKISSRRQRGYYYNYLLQQWPLQWVACHTSVLEANRHRQQEHLPNRLRDCELMPLLIGLFQGEKVCQFPSTIDLCNILGYSRLKFLKNRENKTIKQIFMLVTKPCM